MGVKTTAELTRSEAALAYLDLTTSLSSNAALHRVDKLSNSDLADILEHLNDALRRTEGDFGDTDFSITDDCHLLYMLIRSDDNGHTFLIEDGLNREAASAAYQRVERGHKQMYEIVPYCAVERERIIVERGIKL